MSERAPKLAIEARKLRKAFGAVVAVRGVDLAIPEGSFSVLLGPNGAGKTTLMRMLATLLKPSSGTVKIWGQVAKGNTQAIRRKLGVISHQLYLYPHLTARENLHFYGRLYALENLNAAIEAALKAVNLWDVRDRLVDGFSRGMQQRLSIARALIHTPDVVLLDEPFTGLDHQAAMVLADLLRGLQDGHRTFLMVTHNLAQGAQLGDRLFIQVRGRIVHRAEISDLDEQGLAALYADTVRGAEK